MEKIECKGHETPDYNGEREFFPDCALCASFKEDFEQGYDAAIDDVEEAMRLSEKTRTTVTPSGMVMDMYNDPAEWVPILKELRKKRFPNN